MNNSAALRVAIGIETLSAFVYLSQCPAQCSAAVVEMVPIESAGNLCFYIAVIIVQTIAAL